MKLNWTSPSYVLGVQLIFTGHCLSLPDSLNEKNWSCLWLFIIAMCWNISSNGWIVSMYSMKICITIIVNDFNYVVNLQNSLNVDWNLGYIKEDEGVFLKWFNIHRHKDVSLIEAYSWWGWELSYRTRYPIIKFNFYGLY